MIGGEHKKERYSERLANAQNQPRNRGYLPGTQLMTGGYSTSTLQGNWIEERSDAGFYDGKAAVSTGKEKNWTTTYRSMVGSPKTLSNPNSQFTQETLIEIVDRTKSTYPGHQPHFDSQLETTNSEMFTTVCHQTYRHPEEWLAQERAYVPPVVGGSPSSQATGVLLQLRRQLELTMPGLSAFPGNVARTVRHTLQQHASQGDGMLNSHELERGLSDVGVVASEPECIALIRYYDRTGDGTASLVTLVQELRGKLGTRRQQLMEKVYKLLEDNCSDRIVRLQRMAELVDVDQLPHVQSGQTTATAARQAFVDQWDAHSPQQYISLEVFCRYFGDASFEIAKDGDFERIMRNVWHLSGGAGKSQNTSCRRVEIVHLNGRTTTEEVMNDLDIKDGDTDMESKIRQRLAHQGVKDIKEMRLI